MANNTKVFRSLIKKYFPDDLIVQLGALTQAHDVDNNTKTLDVIELLNQYHVPFSPLGNGTNRYGILIDGYAVKIALDRAGVIDNQREYKYSEKLYPYVIKVFECNKLIAVTEYVTIFEQQDYIDNQAKMREILHDITENFLAGDIGVSSINYVNWGMRPDGSITILDFAYIYDLSYRGFLCTCEDEGVLQYDNDYNYLVCPFCRRKWTFADIRKRISRKDELEEIGDIYQLGYVLRSAEEELPIDPTKSPLTDEQKKEFRKQHEKREKIKVIHPKQKYNDVDNEDQEKMLRELNNMLSNE